MIYFIDEDVIQLKPFAIELKIRGYDVKQIDNADKAYEELSVATNISLVVLDIMLATEEKGSSRYDRERTRDFIKTGLVLLEDLIEKNEKYFPERVVIFSMGSQKWLVDEIQKEAKNNNIPYLRKREYGSPYAFGEEIERIINNIEKND